MTEHDSPAPASSGRGVGSGLAAIGIVVAVTLVWGLVSGNGPQGPSGDDAGYAGAGSGPASGTAEDPGSARARPGSEPEMTNRHGVRIDSFVTGSGTRLTLTYTSGLAECYGKLDTPEVVETDGAVTITLTLVPPASPGEEPCPDLAVVGTVPVELDATLGDRSVLDGSFEQRVRVPEAGEPSS